MRRSFYLSLFAMLFVACGVVRADTIFFGSDDAGRSYNGSATYASGTLTITLQNTSNVPSAANDLTGFTFSSLVANVTLAPITSAFAVATPTGYGNFGTYAYNFVGNLTPTAPIVMSFTVGGAGAGSVGSAANFFAVGGNGASDGFKNEPFVAVIDGHFIGDTAVTDAPLPAMAWASLALFGVFGFSQRFNSRRRAIA